jgi:hypothetical protein
MRNLIAILFLAATALGQADAPQLQPDDAIRIREFYRFAEQIQDKVWPGWSKVPAPLLLVTEKTEFLERPPAPPNGFQKIGDDLYARPRQFPVQLQATFPLLGPPALIAVGRPKNTESGSSTPWLIMVMHECFHQLQYAQPGYYEAVQKLGLSKGNNDASWMLRYSFPYDNGDVADKFSKLRDLLYAAVTASDEAFANAAKRYMSERKKNSLPGWQKTIASIWNFSYGRKASPGTPRSKSPKRPRITSQALISPRYRITSLSLR